jgi:hypothetical protein
MTGWHYSRTTSREEFIRWWKVAGGAKNVVGTELGITVIVLYPFLLQISLYNITVFHLNDSFHAVFLGGDQQEK